MANTNVIKASVVVVLVVQVWLVAGKQNGDSYSAEELRLLPKLLERVEKDLTQDYMFHNRYLVRYLRARKLNVDEAEAMIRKTLKWRREQGLGTVMNEDFSWWMKRFPFYNPLDREGRPGLASGIHNFNFRNYVVNGKADKLMRYIYYAFERGLVNLGRVANESNTEYIHGHLLFNLDSYSARNHACIACIPYWIDLAQNYENHYPQLTNKIIAVNGPRLFEIIAQFIRPVLSPVTRNAIHLYGYNQAEWKQEVLKLFPPENITPEFGGTLKLKPQK